MVPYGRDVSPDASAEHSPSFGRGDVELLPLEHDLVGPERERVNKALRALGYVE